MKLIKNTNQIQNISGLIILALHLIGAIGLSINMFRDFFLFLVPFNLILTFLLCFFFISWKQYLKPFVIIYLLGFFVEVVGVKTGLLFGEYIYGHYLGFKFLEVPLIIGVNWLLLIFCTYGLAHKFFKNTFVKIIFASFLMVLLDLAIEPVAIKLGFWSWTGVYVPIQNYFMWFLTSLIMHLVMLKSSVFISLKLSMFILASQLMFFIFLFFRL